LTDCSAATTSVRKKFAVDSDIGLLSRYRFPAQWHSILVRAAAAICAHCPMGDPPG